MPLIIPSVNMCTGEVMCFKVVSEKVFLLNMSKIDEFYKLGYEETKKILEFLEDD